MGSRCRWNPASGVCVEIGDWHALGCSPGPPSESFAVATQHRQRAPPKAHRGLRLGADGAGQLVVEEQGGMALTVRGRQRGQEMRAEVQLVIFTVPRR